MLQVVFLAIVVGGFFYLRKFLRGGGETTEPHPQLTEDQIKQKWRELGFF